MVNVQRGEHPIPARSGGLGGDALSRPRRRDGPSELHLVHVVDVLKVRAYVPDELPGHAIFDRQEREPHLLVSRPHPFDPCSRLVQAEGVRIEAHVDGI